MALKRGFTLIELLIVIAIIGTLAAISIPNLVKYQEEQKAKRANTTCLEWKEEKTGALICTSIGYDTSGQKQSRCEPEINRTCVKVRAEAQ